MEDLFDIARDDRSATHYWRCPNCNQVPIKSTPLNPDRQTQAHFLQKALVDFVPTGRCDVRYWHKADIPFCTANVRFRG